MPICIAGMHRSGTSMVAQLLNFCGLYLGSEEALSRSAPDNEHGFWENTRFVHLNEKLLTLLKGGWDLPPTVSTGWEFRPDLISIHSEAADLIKELGEHKSWGWKDPRNSLTLPFWQQLIPNLKVVICLRNPLEVAQSLQKRNLISQALGLRLWLEYNRRVLLAVRFEQRVITHYDAYFHDPQEELKRVLELLDLPISRETLAHACTAISKSLHHNCITTQDLMESDVPEEVFNLYMGLCEEAGPIYQQVVKWELTSENISSASTISQLKLAKKLKHELRTQLAEKDKAVVELRTQMSELRAQVAEQNQTLQALQQRLTWKRYRIVDKLVGLYWRSWLFCTGKNRIWHLGRKWLPTSLKAQIKRFVLRQPPSPWHPPKPLPTPSGGLTRAEGADHASATSLPLTKTSHFDIVMLPIIDWDFRFQRPQQIARQFAKHGHHVFYLRTHFSEGKEFDDRPFIRLIEHNIAEVQLPRWGPLNIYRNTIDELMLERWLRAFSQIRRDCSLAEVVCIVQLPFWRSLAFGLRERFGWKVLYDCMDKHSGFSTNEPQMLQEEEALSRGSDLILTTARTLLEEHRRYGPPCRLVPNACEFDHFSITLGETPSVLAALSRPIIGYYGAISEWFDSELVAEIARMKPDWSFILIGDTFGAQLNPLQGLPNVHLLGEQSYSSLPAYLHAFDVCVIPFKLTPLTEATDPVKFYEYLGAGKPVVATPLPELIMLEAENLVYLGRTPAEFVAQIEQALKENKVNQVSRRKHFAQQNTWEKRLKNIKAEIHCLYKKTSIIILTHNNLHLNQRCVKSIFDNTLWPNFELIIVDNGSTDGTKEYLQEMAQQHDNVKIILNDSNEGFARANNQGIRAVTGYYIALLNNDTLVTRGWLGRLIRRLDRNPNIGIVGPVTSSSGNEAKIDVDYSSIEEMDEFAQHRAWNHEGQAFEIKMLALFCVVMRRKLFNEVGLLDERFGVGMFEDDDLSLRVKQQGYSLLCAEDTFVHHFGKGTFTQFGEREYLRLFDENRKKFENKWGLRWEPPALRAQMPQDEQVWLLKRELSWLLQHHAQARGIIIYPPTIDWGESLFQRPQQLACTFSNSGYLFLYCVVNPEVDNVSGFKKIAENLYLCYVPLEVFEEIPRPIVWVSRADHRKNLRYFNDPFVVYDYIDELEVFHTYSPQMIHDHKELIKSADLCLATATKLFEEIKAERPDALFCPNAADYDLFRKAKEKSLIRPPEDLEPLLEEGKPIIGYYGALAEWFDYELVKHVAHSQPEWNLVLIGPNYDGSLKRAGFDKLGNIFYLGSKPYPSLPQYLAYFDVATIPFKINKITLATSPIKLFEYMAGGKPVVTTDLPECRSYPNVLIAHSPQEFIEQLKHALRLQDDPEYIATLDRVARENSWEARVARVIKAMQAFEKSGT